MACPYFVPRGVLSGGEWSHPSRLPLGAGWTGTCCAGGVESEPGEAALRDLCNLGNASECPRLPAERDWDAIRFSVAGTSPEQITLWYSCERGHAPIEHGKLTFDRLGRTWRDPHPDPRVHRLATTYLETWQVRQIPAEL